MGKAMAGVLIVAIIAIAVLLLARSINRTAERKSRLNTVLLELSVCRGTIRKIDAELTTQTLAGYFDPQPFQAILTDHKREVTT